MLNGLLAVAVKYGGGEAEFFSVFHGIPCPAWVSTIFIRFEPGSG
jgi:hypothetical protein